LARKYIPVKDAKESKLHLGRSLLYETFNVLVASVEMLAEALNNHLELPRGKILFICTTARIIGRMNRNLSEPRRCAPKN
jgi:hypothetical protein